MFGIPKKYRELDWLVVTSKIKNSIIKGIIQAGAFVQYLGDGPMIMEKVVHIPKYVKPWYIYQLILSQLS